MPHPSDSLPGILRTMEPGELDNRASIDREMGGKEGENYERNGSERSSSIECGCPLIGE